MSEQEESKLDKIARASGNAGDRLNRMANRLGIVIVLVIVGFFILPWGIIAWIIAFGMLPSVFSNK